MKIFFSLFAIILLISISVIAAPPVVKAKSSVTSATKSLTSKKKYFPEDTVGRFIKKNGRDSLINLVNQRIKLSKNYITDNLHNLTNDNSMYELFLFSEYFKLKLKLNLDKDSVLNFIDYKIYSLYGNKLGDTAFITDILHFADTTKLKISIIDSVRPEIHNNHTLFYIALYCSRIKMTKADFDTVFEDTQKLENNDKIFSYWKFSEINKNCFDSFIGTNTYKTKLFNELYPINNIKKFYLDTLPNIKKSVSLDSNIYYGNQLKKIDLEDFYSKYNPLRMLAYSLYADDININTKSDNLMYLLDAQQANGSWSVAKKFNSFDSNMNATIYGLWSLCEFRNKLEKLK